MTARPARELMTTAMRWRRLLCHIGRHHWVATQEGMRWYARCTRCGRMETG